MTITDVEEVVTMTEEVVVTAGAAALVDDEEAGVGVETAADDDKVTLAGRYAPVTSLLKFKLVELVLRCKLSTYFETPPLSVLFM